MEIYIAKSGRESGPFTEDQIKPMVDSGMIELTDSIWHKDLPDWIPVYQHLNLRPPVPSVMVPPAKRRRAMSGEPASFGRRFLAALIDWVVWVIAGGVFSAIWMLLIFGEATGRMSDDDFNRMTFVPALIVGWLYSATMESSSLRATLGKMATGTVVTTDEGQKLNFWQASWRFAGKQLAIVTLSLSWICCAWTVRRQALHDLLAGSVVVIK